MIRHSIALLGLAAALAAAPVSIAQRGAQGAVSGVLAGGAQWRAEMPARWNGTLLLYSRGYAPTAGTPDVAPAPLRQMLLDAGYALAASNYGSGGWSLEQAVPAQRATIAAFAAAHGKPRRVIAWGYSMGGLVTTALAEQRASAIHGGLALCPSIGGATGMMNMALDGAYAFRTLVAPDAGIRLVRVDDDRANGKRVGEAVATAMASPQGRARVALAGVLAGLPGWTQPNAPEPAPGDHDAQARAIAASFAMGVFLPRTDQEQRAGGVFSWNQGVDYAAQLDRSGRRAMIAALYRDAGLDLHADLARLAGGERVRADAAAVAYMMRHYTPMARPRVPLLAVQAIGDGLTSPSLVRGYADAAPPARFRALWLREAGHCGQKPEAVVTAIRYLDARITRGTWGTRPAPFVAYTPPPMLRPCVRGGTCR